MVAPDDHTELLHYDLNLECLACIKALRTPHPASKLWETTGWPFILLWAKPVHHCLFPESKLKVFCMKGTIYFKVFRWLHLSVGFKSNQIKFQKTNSSTTANEISMGDKTVLK